MTLCSRRSTIDMLTIELRPQKNLHRLGSSRVNRSLGQSAVDFGAKIWKLNDCRWSFEEKAWNYRALSSSGWCGIGSSHSRAPDILSRAYLKPWLKVGLFRPVRIHQTFGLENLAMKKEHKLLKRALVQFKPGKFGSWSNFRPGLSSCLLPVSISFLFNSGRTESSC